MPTGLSRPRRMPLLQRQTGDACVIRVRCFLEDSLMLSANGIAHEP